MRNRIKKTLVLFSVQVLLPVWQEDAAEQGISMGGNESFELLCLSQRHIRSIQYHVMGYGIYKYSGNRICRTSCNQQQQICHLPSDQCHPSCSWNIHGYDTSLPDLYTNLSSGMYSTRNEHDPLRNHDDLQPVYRNNHSTGWNNTLRWC